MKASAIMESFVIAELCLSSDGRVPWNGEDWPHRIFHDLRSDRDLGRSSGAGQLGNWLKCAISEKPGPGRVA
jgi:hypothetical protein